MIEDEVARLTSDREVQGWLGRESNRPLDSVGTAHAVNAPEVVAEMCLVSLLVVGEGSSVKYSHLEELMRQLRLEPSLKLGLEDQARQALQCLV